MHTKIFSCITFLLFTHLLQAQVQIQYLSNLAKGPIEKSDLWLFVDENSFKKNEAVIRYRTEYKNKKPVRMEKYQPQKYGKEKLLRKTDLIYKNDVLRQIISDGIVAKTGKYEKKTILLSYADGNLDSERHIDSQGVLLESYTYDYDTIADGSLMTFYKKYEYSNDVEKMELRGGYSKDKIGRNYHFEIKGNDTTLLYKRQSATDTSAIYTTYSVYDYGAFSHRNESTLRFDKYGNYTDIEILTKEAKAKEANKLFYTYKYQYTGGSKLEEIQVPKPISNPIMKNLNKTEVWENKEHNINLNFSQNNNYRGTWSCKQNRDSVFSTISWVSSLQKFKNGKWKFEEHRNLFTLTAQDGIIMIKLQIPEIQNGILTLTPVRHWQKQLILKGSEKTIADFFGVEIEEENPIGEEIFLRVEKMPQFPGGEVEMFKFINSNIKYPEAAKKEGVTGRVIVRFTVMEDGTIESAHILRGIHKKCDAEVVRIVNSMPKWEPGLQGGKPVKVYYTLPVSFKL